MKPKGFRMVEAPLKRTISPDGHIMYYFDNKPFIHRHRLMHSIFERLEFWCVIKNLSGGSRLGNQFTFLYNSLKYAMDGYDESEFKDFINELPKIEFNLLNRSDRDALKKRGITPSLCSALQCWRR